MGEGLSFDGLLLQARDVLRARWKLLLITAVGWALVVFLVDRLRLELFSSSAFEGGRFSDLALPVIAWAPGVIGSAVMTGVVVRTGQPARPLAEALRHWLLAAATILAVLAVVSLGEMALRGLAYGAGLTGEPSPWLTAFAFVPGLISLAAFAYLGMTVPAALERPVTPWKAAAVALKLSEGRRVWLALIALAWALVAAVPLVIINVWGLSLVRFMGPISAVAQMVTPIAVGVLYLELRRLRGAGQPGAASESLA